MNYSKLRGRIREKFTTHKAFALAVGLNAGTLSAKLNGRTQWTCDEVVKVCKVLDIPLEEAHAYFFCAFC